jgi:hypothetical protein
LIPSAPEGWEVSLCRPRNDALDELTAALHLRRSDERRTLWAIDPFEELFTLHDRETQARFARLLGRAVEVGIQVLPGDSGQPDSLLDGNDRRSHRLELQLLGIRVTAVAQSRNEPPEAGVFPHPYRKASRV